jgi:hypothetical protein
MEHFLSKYNQLDELIKINWNISQQSVVFLDLVISISNNSISTKIFQKTSNIFQYIPPTSFHKPQQLHNFIGAELERFFFLSSTYSDYVQTSCLFWHRLIKRGYSHSILHQIYSKFNSKHLPFNWNSISKPPSTILPKPLQQSSFFLKLPFNPSFKHFKLFHLLPNTSNLPNDFQNFMISWHNHPTIGQKLIKAQFDNNNDNNNNNNIDLSLEFSEEEQQHYIEPLFQTYWEHLNELDEDNNVLLINNNNNNSIWHAATTIDTL